MQCSDLQWLYCTCNFHKCRRIEPLLLTTYVCTRELSKQLHTLHKTKTCTIKKQQHDTCRSMQESSASEVLIVLNYRSFGLPAHCLSLYASPSLLGPSFPDDPGDNVWCRSRKLPAPSSSWGLSYHKCLYNYFQLSPLWYVNSLLANWVARFLRDLHAARHEITSFWAIENLPPVTATSPTLLLEMSCRAGDCIRGVAKSPPVTAPMQALVLDMFRAGDN